MWYVDYLYNLVARRRARRRRGREEGMTIRHARAARYIVRAADSPMSASHPQWMHTAQSSNQNRNENLVRAGGRRSRLYLAGGRGSRTRPRPRSCPVSCCRPHPHTHLRALKPICGKEGKHRASCKLSSRPTLGGKGGSAHPRCGGARSRVESAYNGCARTLWLRDSRRKPQGVARDSPLPTPAQSEALRRKGEALDRTTQQLRCGLPVRSLSGDLRARVPPNVTRRPQRGQKRRQAWWWSEIATLRCPSASFCARSAKVVSSSRDRAASTPVRPACVPRPPSIAG